MACAPRRDYLGLQKFRVAGILQLNIVAQWFVQWTKYVQLTNNEFSFYFSSQHIFHCGAASLHRRQERNANYSLFNVSGIFLLPKKFPINREIVKKKIVKNKENKAQLPFKKEKKAPQQFHLTRGEKKESQNRFIGTNPDHELTI